MSKWSKPYRKVGVREKVTVALRRSPWLSTVILDARLGHSCQEVLRNMLSEGLVESRPGEACNVEWKLTAAQAGENP